MPQRIQRKRTKGWRMPEGAIYVGRPSKWGNPFIPSRDRIYEIDGDWWGCRSYIGAVNCYRAMCIKHQPAPERLAEIRGKDLACWCPLDQPCHADVLLELANATPDPSERR